MESPLFNFACFLRDAHPVSQFPKHSCAAFRAEAYVGVGLAMLIAAVCWPGAPIVTAVAIVSLGATEATLARFRNTTALLPITIVHGATYAGLYGLFVSATLHAAGTTPAAAGPYAAVLDIAASVFPMGLAVRHISSGLLRPSRPRR